MKNMLTLKEHKDFILEIDGKNWNDIDLTKRATERKKLHDEFTYVITYTGCYDQLDELDDWCRDHFGDMHGECYWEECEWSWDKWHEASGLKKQLDNEIHYEIIRGKTRESKIHDDWVSMFIKEHYTMIKDEYFPDKPYEHSHKGVWCSYFITKTGYDYGYQDFCFKNAEDAFYFKIMWDDIASKR